MSSDTILPASPNTLLAPVYTEALCRHALTLVALGHRRMTPTDFSTAEEDAITGELTREMRAVIEDDAAPEWTQDYSVQEQVRANTAGKLGKLRPIVDIEFERHTRGPRPRLRFEAKRLGPNHPASGYFGEGGLDAFISRYYDRTHEDAGMLGYVQSHDEATWVEKLSSESVKRTDPLGITEEWCAFVGEEFPPFTYRTKHRDSAGKQAHIIHILLGFV